MSLGHGTAKTSSSKSAGVFPAALRRSVYYDTPQQKITALEGRCKALEEQIRAAQERRDQKAALQKADQVETSTNASRVEELEDKLAELKENHECARIKGEKCELLLKALTSLHDDVRCRASGMRASAPREPLQIVDTIRSLLKQIFAAYQRRETEIEEEIQSNDRDFEPRLGALSESLEQAKREVEEETEACKKVKELFDQYEAEIQAMQNKEKQKSESLLQEQTTLTTQLERTASEVALLNLWTADSLRHIQEQDEKIERIPLKIKQSQVLAKRTHAEQENIEQTLLNQMHLYEKQLSQKANAEAQRDRLLEEIAKLRREIHNLKRDQKHRAVEQLEARLAQHERELTRMQEDIDKLEAAQKTISERLGKKEEDLQQCAKEYGRVQAELHRRIEEDTNRHEQKEEDASKIVKQHPYVAEVLKRKVMEREEEIQKLQNKLRHIMVIEKKMEVQERNFDEERNRYEMELSNWRQKLARSEDRVSVLARSCTMPVHTQAALQAELREFCASDEDNHLVDDQDFEMIVDDDSPARPQAFPTLHGFQSRSPSPAPARSRSPRYATFEEFDEQQKPPPGPRLARPRSAFTGRRLPANQTIACSSASIQVGSLLPQRSRPQSAPRRM